MAGRKRNPALFVFFDLSVDSLFPLRNSDKRGQLCDFSLHLCQDSDGICKVGLYWLNIAVLKEEYAVFA